MANLNEANASEDDILLYQRSLEESREMQRVREEYMQAFNLLMSDVMKAGSSIDDFLTRNPLAEFKENE
jgi:hypothetical protein